NSKAWLHGAIVRSGRSGCNVAGILRRLHLSFMLAPLSCPCISFAEERCMKSNWLLMAAVAGLCAIAGCQNMSGPGASNKTHGAAADPLEPGETKVKLEQTPPAVRATIERELKGAELEDIAMKTRQGKTVYETDIIKSGHKWELLVADDGKI